MGRCLNPSHKGKGDSMENIMAKIQMDGLNPSHKGKGNSLVAVISFTSCES